MSPKSLLSSLLGTAILLGFTLLPVSWVLAMDSPTSLDKITAGYQVGQIDYSEMLVEQMKAFFAPQTLSSEFKAAQTGMIKSGTGLVMQVLDHWSEFTEEQRSLLAGFLGRPAKAFSYDSPEGYFLIHYDTQGPEAVPPQDNNSNGIPDFVERIGQYCDSARAVYSDQGYLPPPMLDTAGGDGKYDIYLLSLSGYGMTVPEAPGDSVWNDRTSYIGIHCTFYFSLFPNDDPEGDSIGAQKVTCAHEFFHAVQLAYNYDINEYLWLMEATATWMEEIVFPEVNDNYNFLSYFFNVPERKLISTTNYHHYGALVWAAFLSQRFDPAIIRWLWEACRYNGSLDATDSSLAPFGSDLAHAYQEFTLWNYHTGGRAVPGKYYSDAAHYPEVKLDHTYSTLVQDTVRPVTAPDGLGCNYIRLLVDSTARGTWELVLDGSDLVRWGNVAVLAAPSPDSAILRISNGIDLIYIYVPSIEDYTSVAAIPEVISRYGTVNPYVLRSSVLPHGDANFDRVVNVGDASYLVQYVFRGGTAPKPILASGDANCDGNVNVADAVRIINYVFSGGEEPCAGSNR